MKQIFVLVIILFITIPSVLYSDMGIPNVHALCRIELKDGKTIEGVILVGIGGWQEYLDTSGFLVISKEFENYEESDPLILKLDYTKRPKIANMRAVLFNDKYYAYMPNKGKSFIYPPHSGVSGSSGGWARMNQRIYYILDITSLKYQISHKEEQIQAYKSDSCVFFKKDIVRHAEYKLIPYIPLYPCVPSSLFIHHDDKGFLKVDIDSIESFGFILEPSQEWLDQIFKVKKEWSEKNDTFEVVFPVWMHEIFRNRDRYSHIKFKPWQF